MKQYRVSREFVKHTYGSSWSALRTCAREFDTIEEALECVEQLRNMFPDAYVMDSGDLGRTVDLIDRKEIGGIKYAIVMETNVFWMILEHGEGLTMPIRIQ